MPAVPLGAVVIARDEGHQIAACLASLRGADDLLVVDDRSQDDTVARAAAAGARIVAGAGDLAALRALGTARSRGRWVLMIDADERLPPGGLGVVRAAIAAAGDTVAFRLPIRTHLGGRFLRWGGYYPAARVRLFRRDAVQWPPARVHERPAVAGPVRQLDLPLTHLSYRDLEHATLKTRRYALWAAADLRARGRRPGVPTAIVRTAWRFTRVFILRGGFLMGTLGVRLAWLQARGVWWRFAAARMPPVRGGSRRSSRIRRL